MSSKDLQGCEPRVRYGGRRGFLDVLCSSAGAVAAAFGGAYLFPLAADERLSPARGTRQPVSAP